jgi:tRNA threonylcarbamoyladenosine biosynthesis protein TsaB
MVLLAADTSGKHGSIALARQEAGRLGVLEIVAIAGGTFSAQLVPQIAALLAKHKISLQAVDALVAASGPGSFTGLRVGLAAIKGLAEVLEKPIVAISLLEAVARAGDATGPVWALLDAGRGEVYAGEYEVTASHARCLREELLRPEELRARMARHRVVSPDANLIAVLQAAQVEVQHIERPRADALLRLGWERLVAGETVSPAALDANYIRRSDAEIFLQSGPSAVSAPALQIRPAKQEDIPAMKSMAAAATEAAQWSAAQYEALFTAGVPRLVLVAEENGTFRGLLVARTISGECELENIVVAQEARRRGVGALLLRSLLERARAERATACWLEVRKSNTAARRLYATAGFQESGRRRGYYQQPSEDAVLYRIDF